jgi:hypothetical protein
MMIMHSCTVVKSDVAVILCHNIGFPDSGQGGCASLMQVVGKLEHWVGSRWKELKHVVVSYSVVLDHMNCAPCTVVAFVFIALLPSRQGEVLVGTLV